jgi:hypothetical protein
MSHLTRLLRRLAGGTSLPGAAWLNGLSGSIHHSHKMVGLFYRVFTRKHKHFSGLFIQVFKLYQGQLWSILIFTGAIF